MLLGYQRIGVNKDEWQNFKSLHEHVKAAYQLLQQSENYIAKYYQCYVEECQRLKVSSLGLDTTLLTDDSHLFDSRRFHGEIPIILKEKLANDILLTFQIHYTNDDFIII